MNPIAEVRKEREDLARVLKRHSGIRRIVEDLYPDKAHFIFELLQNAEDRGATEVSFSLTSEALRFEHNGETFRLQDIYAITDIGEGTKADDDDKIGRFGVGFKAVFAYSETPHIWSPSFSFRISDLVLPSALPGAPDIQEKTRFEFPFNNPKKTADDAFSEIKSGLSELAESTLLFLPNIESIKWSIDSELNGEILRIAHTATHIEVMKQSNGQKTTSSHFLKFDQVVKGLEKQRVALAFALDFLPNVSSLSSAKPLAKQLKIVPTQGQVAVFFPANKEVSGLRFHLHAPFVPELSRASIKSTPANNPLFDQLASLAASSLHEIRDLGLLTTDFLGVLPNPQDRLGDGYGYQQIRNSIFEAMKTQPLFPTHDKGHAPAKILIQAKASLKDLLNEADIKFLVDSETVPPRWAASRALQGTNVERFMSGLGIRDWDTDAFVKRVAEKTGGLLRPVDAAFLAWLGTKNAEWHQQFYSHLDGEGVSASATSQLRRCRIIRTVELRYAVAGECHFPDEDSSETRGMLFVDNAVYSSGKSKAQQESARRFLETAGVTVVGERQRLEALLKSSYSDEHSALSERAYLKDLRRFMKMLEDDASFLEPLSRYSIIRGSDNKWHKAKDVYLDSPIIDTALGDYFALLGTANRLVPPADIYHTSKLDNAKLTKFLEALGAHTKINLIRMTCDHNPQKAYLHTAPGERYTNPIDRDYGMNKLGLLAKQRSERLSRLVWSTMTSLKIPDNAYAENPLRAVYRKNERGGARFADSHLVHQLRNEEWIPQRGGHFVRPSDARPELLPDGFTFDAGWHWIKAIKFGDGVRLQSERARAASAAAVEQVRRDQEAAATLGFKNPEIARQLAEIPPEELSAIVSEHTRRKNFDLPDKEIGNPLRRSDRVTAGAAAAPGRQSVERTRSVSLGREEVKVESDQYLRQQYTNADAEQICQICKDALPFRLDNGAHFFEAVELLPELNRRHYQNYLCLCPNHSAMFRFANGSKQSLTDSIAQQTGNQVPVVLANQEVTIYFTKAHLADLQAVIKADAEEPSSDEGALNETS